MHLEIHEHQSRKNIAHWCYQFEAPDQQLTDPLQRVKRAYHYLFVRLKAMSLDQTDSPFGNRNVCRSIVSEEDQIFVEIC